MSKCCGTCKWTNISWNGWGKCEYPMPYWVVLSQSVPDKVHVEYDGGDCDVYEAKP